ncbi:MAG: flagellar biosynthesis protein FlhB [Parvularculaceae bacterium]
MADDDKSQRTEEPTPKRLADARAKGDAPKSQEATALASLLAAGLCLWLLAPGASRAIGDVGRAFLERPHDFATDPAALSRLFASASAALVMAVGAVLLAMALAAVLANVVQARPVFAPGRLKPGLEKISPIAGAKRVFGPTGWFNFAKGLVKLVAVGAACALATWPDRQLLLGLFEADAAGAMALAKSATLKSAAYAAGAMAVVTVLDLAWQRRAWKRRLRMTREEVRREQREQEGDPQVKNRIRRLRDARGRRRMVAAVADATVLVMNPTHVAVALKYAPEASNAPVCVAKGLDALALRLRDAAEAAGVPVIVNPPLARSLHASVDLDEEIPLAHYEAVAKVIGFVMARGRAAGASRGRA